MVQRISEQKLSGIYMILNKINRKCYVGSSKDIINRWSQHKNKLLKEKHINQYLQNAFNKYGLNNFEFWIIEECSEEDLLVREQYWMDFHVCYDHKYGYNICSKSDRPVMPQERREKVAAQRRNKTLEEFFGVEKAKEMKEKMSKSQKNRFRTKDEKKRISQLQKGKKRTQEHKNKLSEERKGKSFEERFGTEKAKEMKEKQSKAGKGKKQSKEHIKNRFSSYQKTIEKRRNKESYKSKKCQLSDRKVIELLKILLYDEKSVLQIEKETGISRDILYGLKNNKTYKHIKREDI